MAITTTPPPEVWMQVIDRKRIAKLMAIQNVSLRQMAAAAGWQGHSYVKRILDGDIKTVTPERAARIAHRLGVGVDDLFRVRVSTDTARSVRRGAA